MKKSLALLLALILCLTPLSALAEGEEQTNTEPQEETVTYTELEDVDGGLWFYADGTDRKRSEVRNVTQTRDEYAGVSVNTNDHSAVEVTANKVTTSGEFSYGVQVSTRGGSSAYVATSTVTTTGDRSIGVEVDAFNTSIVTMYAGAVNTEGNGSHGVVVILYGSAYVEVTTRSVTASGDGVSVLAHSSEPTTVTVKGNVDATYYGVIALTSGGQETVTVTGSVTGGIEGIYASSNYEGSSSTIIVGNTGDAGVFTGGTVTGGTTGIVADVGSGGHAQVRTGDVEGGTTGVSAFPFSTGGTADILIDGTLTAGQQAVVVNENTTEDELTLTVWKVEQAGEGEALVAGSGAGENAFTDDSIQYIVRTDATIRCGDQEVGTLSAAKDETGEKLDTVTFGNTAYQVAREGDTVYLNMDYDTDKYQVDGVYADEEKTVAAETDEDGNFFTKVRKGGGVLLSALLMVKHDHTGGEAACTSGPICEICGKEYGKANGHTPGAPVREESYLIPGLYDMVTYCTVCGQEISRTSHVDMAESQPVEDAFARFSRMAAERVRAAEANGVVTMDAGDWIGLQRPVFEALAERSDVTLKVACLVNGESTELTIPAGFDLLTPLGTGWMLTFEEIGALIG